MASPSPFLSMPRAMSVLPPEDPFRPARVLPRDAGYPSSDLPRLHHGAQLFDAGQPWHAHEVWEEAWKEDRSAQRDAWKGLIQVAAAVYHLQRGNPGPVPALLVRARIHLEGHGHHLSPDPQALIQACRRLEATGEVPVLGPLVHRV